LLALLQVPQSNRAVAPSARRRLSRIRGKLHVFHMPRVLGKAMKLLAGLHIPNPYHVIGKTRELPVFPLITTTGDRQATVRGKIPAPDATRMSIELTNLANWLVLRLGLDRPCSVFLWYFLIGSSLSHCSLIGWRFIRYFSLNATDYLRDST